MNPESVGQLGALKTAEWPVLTEQTLAMPRAKPRSILQRVGYRLAWLGRRLTGRRRLLCFLLDSSWLLRRLAFEVAGEIYGDSFHNRALSEERLAEFIPPGGSVLDIGCGPGRWSRASARFAASVVGVDQDARHLENARRQTCDDHVQYIQADVSVDLAQRFAERCFDMAIVLHVLEHIDDPDTFLKSVSPIASQLLIEVPDFDSDCLNLVRHRLRCVYYSDGDHVREYTEAILADQLVRNGWRVQQLWKRNGALLALAAHADSPALHVRAEAVSA